MISSTDTITIFGATGQIGRALVRHLAPTGARLRIPTRDCLKARPLQPAGQVGQITPIACDLGSDASLAAVIDGADHVVNLVGVLKGDFQALHARLPGRIGQAAAEAGVARVVHVSSLGAGPGAPSRYLRSKAAGEAALTEAFAGAVILRPSLVFGPDDQLFNRFGAMSVTSPCLPLFGGGATRFQPIYAGDVAEAICRALDRRDAAGRVYELGGPRVLSFREMMELMASITGRPRPFVTLPMGLAKMTGALLGWLPGAPFTLDQVRSFESDSVCGGDLPGLAALGIQPTALEAVLPRYLDRFRPGGKFGGAQGRAA